MIELTVDGKPIAMGEGKNLLQSCLENDIYIPHLCFLEGMSNPPASCRLCFVEVENQGGPVPACKVKPESGMVVRTDTAAVRRLQKSALRLLLSVHDVDCGHCLSNKRCELQKMARFLGIKLRPRGLEHLERQPPMPQQHPLFEFDLHRCVLCGKCVFICQQRLGHALLTFAERGFDTVITAFDDRDSGQLPCGECLACVEVCPVSAISLKSSSESKYKLPVRG